MSTPYLILLLLGLFGVGETTYLLYCRTGRQPAACPIGDRAHCRAVLESKYNSAFFGIHNDLLGVVFHTCIVAAAGYALVTGSLPTQAFLGLRLAIGGSAAFSVYLVYVQSQVLKQWCFWCVLSALTTWTMAVVVFGFLN